MRLCEPCGAWRLGVNERLGFSQRRKGTQSSQKKVVCNVGLNFYHHSLTFNRTAAITQLVFAYRFIA
jgi:hypothetical protein